MLVDTHVHLDAAEFAADAHTLIAQARAAGVGRFVVPAVTPATFDGITRLAAAHASVAPAWGLHPLYVEGLPEDALARLRAQIEKHPPVAIGEIGLDAYPGAPDWAAQQRIFQAQLALARELGLPVIVHARRAVDAVLHMVRKMRPVGGIVHAFNGSMEQARQLLACNFRLGFGGAMTFAGSTRIRRLAAELPLHAIVLETDAPDIPPAWAHDQRTEPAWIARYAQVLADLRQTSVAEIIARTTENAYAALPALAQDKPFAPLVPNATTVAAMRAARAGELEAVTQEEIKNEIQSAQT